MDIFERGEKEFLIMYCQVNLQLKLLIMNWMSSESYGCISTHR